MRPALDRPQRAGFTVRQTAGSRRYVLAAAVLAALLAGAIAGAAYAPVAVDDPDLAMLIRFMAVVKALIALAAAGLVAWRFGAALSAALAAGYIGAVALMAVSPGLIWSQTALPLASACFHAGLLIGLALAAGDGLARRRA